MSSLRLDWCSHAAAKYAVEHWHYSRSLPTPPLVRVGVWEDERYIGCVLFSRGANNNLHKPYRLDATEICELTRVALAHHKVPVSRIVAVAIRLLTKQSPGLRLIVSYADPNHGHTGGIYQAGNWIYTGQTSADFKAIDPAGHEWHSRQVSRTGVKRQYGSPGLVPKHENCTIIPLQGKHRYLMPLDDAMRQQVQRLAKPYPRPASVASDTAPHQDAIGGATPTAGLHHPARQTDDA